MSSSTYRLRLLPLAGGAARGVRRAGPRDQCSRDATPGMWTLVEPSTREVGVGSWDVTGLYVPVPCMPV